MSLVHPIRSGGRPRVAVRLYGRQSGRTPTSRRLVDAMPAEPIGVLDEVVVDRDGRPTELVVACGWFGRRRCSVGVDEVHDIEPENRRVRVRRSAASIAAELHRT